MMRRIGPNASGGATVVPMPMTKVDFGWPGGACRELCPAWNVEWTCRFDALATDHRRTAITAFSASRPASATLLPFVRTTARYCCSRAPQMQEASSPGSEWRCLPPWRLACFSIRQQGQSRCARDHRCAVVDAAACQSFVADSSAENCASAALHGSACGLVTGIGLALSSIGFGAILAFSGLLFAERGWSPVWLGFSAYAAALASDFIHPKERS